MNKLSCDVVIIGGAIAGGMLAANLKNSGLDVIILEAQPEIPQLKRGDLLSPSTVSELARLDMLPKFLKRGAVQLHTWLALGPELETLAYVPLAATAPEPYNYCIALPHPLLQDALAESVSEGENIRFMRGMRMTEMLKDESGAAIGVRAAGRGGPVEISARLVAGCDGATSMVREAAGIATSIETYPYSYLMLTSERSPEQPADQQTEIWGAEGFCGLFPITPDLVRCAVQAETGELNRWRSMGLSAVHDELKRRFPFFETMRLLDEGFYTYKIRPHHAEAYVADGVVLLGDAVHITPPYYGMGMNMSMRDAHHAAPLIIDLLDAGERPSAAALQPYENQARTFNDYVITASRLYGKVAAGHPKNHAVVEAALRHVPALDPATMSIVYGGYDAPLPTQAELETLRGAFAALAA